MSNSYSGKRLQSLTNSFTNAKGEKYNGGYEISYVKDLNNKNLNAKINFDVKDVYDFDRFSDLSLKLKIEEGNYNFSNFNIIWKENVNVRFSDSFLNFNKEKINFYLENSLMLVTALAPRIGYDSAAKIAKNALKNGTTLKHEAIKSGLISEKEYKVIVDPKKMVGPS